ncbi:MAG: isochorismate synthase [Cyclobacteriaceae bacterium]|jgi:isochorismate synthase
MKQSSEQVRFVTPELSFIDKLNAFFKASVKSNLPLAIWKAPRQNEVNAVCQLDKSSIYPEEIESAPKGYYFVPFDKKGESKPSFIKADLTLNSKENELKIDPIFNNDQSIDDFVYLFHEASSLQGFKLSDYLSNENVVQKDKEAFKKLVEESIEAIRQGHYQKIVPSRTKEITLSANFNPIDEFFKLCYAYDNAFVSIVFIPEVGLWMGATPELLLSVENMKLFKTEALAGTQGIENNFDLSKAAWRQKEIEEQALVSRYIINCFKSIRLREFDEYGPKTVQAGNLIHLKTEFSVDMEKVSYPLLGTAMLDLLHPTSAICGMPMKTAAKFLKDREGFDRSYFSGYLGPSNIENKTSLFVNLRCMHILKNKAILYAGAGVTEDSDPESEWKETEMKFQTLLNVIQ